MSLKKLRNLSLILIRGPWRLQRGSNSLNLVSVNLRHWFELAASSNKWTRNYEDPCLLRADLFLGRLEYLIKLSSGTHASQPVLLDMELMIQMIHLQFKKNCAFLKLSIVCYLIFFVNFRYERIHIFPWSKENVWNHSSHFNIPFIRKSSSTYAVSTKVACLGTTYGVTSGNNLI